MKAEAGSAPVPEAPTPPMSDLVWRATMSGLLKELTAEVLALTEVVMKMNEKLAEHLEGQRYDP